ncbi:MAG: hypothetical protein WC076_05855 [Terrimicrobiaceae bacterium]|nr:hypothetical protein [Terrimicrobiaceae bacterium]
MWEAIEENARAEALADYSTSLVAIAFAAGMPAAKGTLLQDPESTKQR